jgi:predicted metal-dependent phosphoesterase TrpH
MAEYLKVDFHTHTAEDSKDIIRHDARELIDTAAELDFDAIAITNHDIITYSRDLAGHAEKRGILLIPGIEATLSKKHVVILNPAFSSSRLPSSLDDLPRLVHEQSLIIAPHPYYPQSCSLRDSVTPLIQYFDAMEYSHFYHTRLNYNLKAVIESDNLNLPLIGSSDCHFIWELGTTFSLVEADKDISSILEAVKSGRVKVVTAPLSTASISRTLWGVLKMRTRMGFRDLKKFLN